MQTEDVINPVKTDEDSAEISLRPLYLRDFVGQTIVCEKLSVFLASAKKREAPLDHILLSGPPGLGKTTLAAIIANEMNASIKSTSAPVIERAGDLASILTTLKENDVLFIDEIHRLKTVVEEVLYSAMEDFFVDVKVGEGVSAKSFRVPLPKFTLVGATTRAGLLSAPLYDRFGIVERLNFYGENELINIAKRTSKMLDLQIDDLAALELAKRSRGTPRVVNRLVRRLRDYAVVGDIGIVLGDFAKNALTSLGVDECGFDALDKEYLTVIVEHYGGGPVGLDTLSVSLSEENDTIEDVIEPYLIQSGYIKRTPKGRVATKKTYQYLNKNIPINISDTEENTLFDME